MGAMACKEEPMLRYIYKGFDFVVPSIFFIKKLSINQNTLAAKEICGKLKQRRNRMLGLR